MTFEGTTEMGNPFMVRQSYLPMEIHWGHSFVSIISKPEAGDTHYYVDMTRRGLPARVPARADAPHTRDEARASSARVERACLGPWQLEPGPGDELVWC